MAVREGPAGRGRGRRGGIEVARELVTLISALRHEGDLLSAGVVAARMGCSLDHARHLLNLLLDIADEEGTGRLCLGADDDDMEVELCFGGVAGRALRLTTSETIAVEAALRALGMAQGDVLADKVRRALCNPVTGPGVQTSLESLETDDPNGAVCACAKAIAAGDELSFAYRSVSGEPSERLVLPLGLRHDGGLWYLDAFDLVRRGERTFRCDRMTKLGTSAVTEGGTQGDGPRRDGGGEGTREVELTFTDPRLLEFFRWPALEVMAEGGGRTRARIPFYGGIWLIRRLAACGDGVIVDDEDLRREVSNYATGLLGKG